MESFTLCKNSIQMDVIMLLKFWIIFFYLIFIPIIAYSDIPINSTGNSPIEQIQFKSKSKKCREEFTDKKQQRVCKVNLKIGIFKLLPHIYAVQNQPDSKNNINNCVKNLDLYSRIHDYDLSIKCLKKIHGKQLDKKSVNDISELKLQNTNPEQLLKLGEALLFGIKVNQDLIIASKFLINAHLKGKTDSSKYLVQMMDYIESNNLEFPESLSKKIYEIIFSDIFMAAEKQAKNGNAKAAYLLAEKAARKNDYKTANMWYKIAAKKNHSGAINNLAVNYAKGKGLEKNVSKAIELYTKAASLGSKYAQQTLGHRYVHGRGVEKNIKKGIEYYKQSAKQGHAKAAYELAELYRKGTMVVKDYHKSLENYHIAASGRKSLYNKVPKARSWIGYFYEKGFAVKKDVNEAFKWYLRAANQGDLYAQSQLGTYYQKGIAVEKNLSIAFNWYLKAAKRDQSYSQRKIGYLYQFGHGTNKDLVKSYQWYLKAGERGDSYAQHQLGIINRDGRGVSVNMQKSYYWFNKAARQNKKESMYALANLLWNGQGVEVNKAEASIWYHKSAEKNYALAQFWLGEMYASGQVVKRDLKKACRWTLKASNNGNNTATLNYSKFCM